MFAHNGTRFVHARVFLIGLVGGDTINPARIPGMEEPRKERGSPIPEVSLDGILNHIGFGRYQMVAFILAGLTGLSFGFEITTFSLIAESLDSQWGVDGVKFAILPSVTGVSNIIGGLFYGYLCDTYGRVWPYALAMVNIAVFSLASAFSPNYETFVCLRFVVGFGVTGGIIFLFAALTEVLPVRNRGKVLVLIMLVESIGICATGGLAWWLIPRHPTYGWRYLVIATSVPSFFVAGFRIVFPFESPRYLVARGDHKRAHKVLLRMAQFNGKDLPFPLSAIETIPSSRKPSLKTSCLKLGSVFKKVYLRTTISLSIIYVAHTVAYYCLAMFIPTILGKLVQNSYFTTFIGYLGQIPGVLLMSIIVEWKYVGRLNSMRFFICLAVATLILFATVQNTVSVPVLTIFINFSTVPLTALMLSYMSEYYPTTIRGSALAFFNNLSAVFGLFFPYLGGYTTDVFGRFPWMFPSIWALFYLVVLLVTFCLQQETLMVNLLDQ